MNEIDIIPLPYVCISPELGKFSCFTPNNSNVRLILKADVQM